MCQTWHWKMNLELLYFVSIRLDMVHFLCIFIRPNLCNIKAEVNWMNWMCLCRLPYVVSRRALADTRQIGKLTREQFALSMHLIQQKVSKGIDPPQSLTADMIPPSERSTPLPVSSIIKAVKGVLMSTYSHPQLAWYSIGCHSETYVVPHLF